jgi:hypothetical protein
VNFLERRLGEVRKTDTRVAGRGGGYAKATGSNAGAETGRRPRRGEIRAAGPYNSSLPECVQAKHRGRTSQNNPSRDCLETRWAGRKERFWLVAKRQNETFHPRFAVSRDPNLEPIWSFQTVSPRSTLAIRERKVQGTLVVRPLDEKQALRPPCIDLRRLRCSEMGSSDAPSPIRYAGLVALPAPPLPVLGRQS